MNLGSGWDSNRILVEFLVVVLENQLRTDDSSFRKNYVHLLPEAYCYELGAFHSFGCHYPAFRRGCSNVPIACARVWKSEIAGLPLIDGVTSVFCGLKKHRAEKLRRILTYSQSF